MNSITPVRVTKEFGHSLDNLEMLWYLRFHAERRLSEHLSGQNLSADEWAAINTPDEAWTIKAPGYTPPPVSWKIIKDEWLVEGTHLAMLAKRANRNVRIATGHEPIGKLVHSKP